MNVSEWADLHGETGEVEKELVNETRTTYNTLINEYVDYEVLVHIRVFDDGSRICEVEDELLNLYDDEGTMVEQFSVTLPSKYVQDALERAEDQDVY